MTTKNFCVKTLNALKRLTLWFPLFLLFVYPVILVFSVSWGEWYFMKTMEMILGWVILFFPIYWFLLIIQKIMTCIFNNPDEYVNMYDEYGNDTYLF